MLASGPYVQNEPDAQDKPPAEHDHPAPQKATKGVGSFTYKSTITYASTGQKEEVRGDFVFPDRARLDFTMKTAKGVEIHRTLALYGDQILQRQRKVSRVEGVNHPLARMTFEAKRALFAWPLGFEWHPTEDGKREAFVREFACCDDEPIGRLLAVLDDEGRPLSIQGYRGTRALETLHVKSWGEQRGRPYPKRIIVFAGDKRIMEELVTDFRINSRYLDKYFQLEDLTGGAPQPLRVFERKLIGMTYRREKLKRKSTWEEALAEAERIRARYAKKLGQGGPELDPQPTFELTLEGRPKAFLLRLKTPSSHPPGGWKSVGERPGFMLLLSDLKSVGVYPVGMLTKALPRGAGYGAPLLKILPESAPARYALMLAVE